jgi:CCR4-NOT complex subunit CAF16
VVVRSLNFSFPMSPPVIQDLSLELPRGSRCLLTGANGAGKTSLLQVLAGKYLVGEDAVRILGRPAFHDIQLTASGDLSYLGPQWRRDIAFAGNNVALQGDIGAGQMLFGVEGVDPERRDRLVNCASGVGVCIGAGAMGSGAACASAGQDECRALREVSG